MFRVRALPSRGLRLEFLGALGFEDEVSANIAEFRVHVLCFVQHGDDTLACAPYDPPICGVTD